MDRGSHFEERCPKAFVVKTIKDLAVVYEVKIQFFVPPLYGYFHYPSHICNVVSGAAEFTKTSLILRNLCVHKLLQSFVDDFVEDFTRLGNQRDGPIIFTFFEISFFGMVI